MEIAQDYFPSKLALGEQFCNRKKEKAFLSENIYKCRHSVLVAPRRYGKSSLAINLAHELKMPMAIVDLFLAHDDMAITKRLLNGISEAVTQLLPLNQKILLKLQALFRKFRVSLGAHGFNIEASIEASGLDTIDQIFQSLRALSLLAKEQKKKIVFFIDEFQDIRETPNSKAIQGAIRHVAQETENITFIFSGSNRRLLLELFDDQSKPLYMLCDIMQIERMDSKDYLPHLNNLAKKCWGKILPDIVFEKIIVLSELHPYYVNLLCNEIWKLRNLPTIDDVYESWHNCYQIHEDRLIAELEKLTAKQQSILKNLALFPSTEPTGQQFVQAAKVPISTINQTVKSLMDKDMVYKIKKIDELIPQISKNQIRLVDPLLAYALRKYA